MLPNSHRSLNTEDRSMSQKINSVFLLLNSGFSVTGCKGALAIQRVYLLSVNTYDFPSAQQNDNSISEKYFYKDSLNLEAEILTRLEALTQNDIEALYQPYGKATDQARIDYAAERLRLLFVGITRARTELTITWNSGDSHHKGAEKNSASIPLIALKAFLETQNEELP